MLAIAVEFLHGTMRAASADDVTLTGDASVEWPPSPARLFSAFVAADGTGNRCRVTGGNTGLNLLEEAPVILADGEGDVVESGVRDRFVVIDETKDGSVQEYPARGAQLVRSGARVSMRDPRLLYLWEHVEPTENEAAALRLRAARVGYLGCADSPVRVRVLTDPDEVPDDLEVWRPDPEGDRALSVPFPQFLDQLDDAFVAWSGGEPRRRSWISPRLVAYRSPDAPAPRSEEPSSLWLRFDRAVGARRVLDVAETLRSAVLDHVDRLVGGPDAVPEVLHGHHHPGNRGVEHARWLPLPDAGFEHSDGRIHGACIWLPAGTDAVVVDTVRQALANVERLVRPGVFDVGVSGFDGTRAPWASNPQRWTREADRWVSVFPVVHERFTKKGPSLDELALWCAYAGLPAPVNARWSQVPLVRGAAMLRGNEVRRPGQQRRPVSHLEVRFPEPVRGPIAIGQGRHFGLGLMAPDAPGRR